MKNTAAWVGIGITVLGAVITAVWLIPSYADAKKAEAVAEHDEDLAAHKARQEKSEDKVEKKLEKLDDKIGRLADTMDSRLDAQMQLLTEIRAEQKAANRRGRNGN